MPGRKDARTTEKPFQQHIKLPILEWVISNRLAITLLAIGTWRLTRSSVTLEQFFKEPIERFTLGLNADLFIEQYLCHMRDKEYIFE